MFRIVQLQVNRNSKITFFRPFCNHQWNSGNEVVTASKNVYREPYSDYFVNSDRYTSFRMNSVIFHQFDDETHNVAVWHKVTAKNDIIWSGLPQECSNDDLIQAFEDMIKYSVSSGISLSDPVYDCFVDKFIQKLNQFELNEIVRAFQMFARAPLEKDMIRQRNYIDLCMAFDQILTINSIELRPNQILFLSSIWRHIPLAKKSYFSQLSGRLLNRYLKQMSAPQVSESLYYLNCLNKQVEDIRAFENIFEKTISDMNLQELAIVMWTFRRIDTKVQKSELRSKLYSFLEIQDFDHLEESFLLRIVNFLAERPPKTNAERDQLQTIMKTISRTLDTKSINLCALVAAMGTSVRVFDDESITILFQRMLNQPDTLWKLNLFALEKVSRIIDLYPKNSDMMTKVGSLILEQMKNRLESIVDPHGYSASMNIIRNLLTHHIYDLELLDNILRSDFIKKMNNSKQLYLSIYKIDAYTRINLKDIYNGNQLTDDYLAKIKYLIEYAPDQVNNFKKTETQIYNIENVIRKYFEHYKFVHALAHHKFADLFVCVDKSTLASKNILSNYPTQYNGKCLEASQLTQSDANLMVFAFIAVNVRNFKDKVPVSFLKMKREQLSLLGYHVVIIPTWEEDIDRFIIQEMNNKLKILGIQKKFEIY